MGQDNPECNKGDVSGDNINLPEKSGRMPAEERRKRVLRFIVESELALPRKVIYRNMKYEGATFSESSLKNYLNTLQENEYISRVDAQKLEDRELEPSDRQAGYYVPTRRGTDVIQQETEDDSLILD